MLMEKEYCLVYLSLSFLTVLSDVIHADALVEMDTYFDGYQFWSLPVNGIGACTIACVRTTMCLSFNFDLTDRKCEMNSQVLENHRDFGRSKRKSVYSNIRNWPPEVMSFIVIIYIYLLEALITWPMKGGGRVLF